MEAPASVERQPEIDELISRLELSLVEPDPDYDTDDDGSSMTPSSKRPEDVRQNGNNGCSIGASSGPSTAPSSSSSRPASSSSADGSAHHKTISDNVGQKAKASGGAKNLSADKSPSHHQEPPQRAADAEDKKSAGRFDFIRKLRGGSSRSSDSNKSNRRRTLEKLKVDSLPQLFVAKYIGHKLCRGLWGIQFTREPVDTLVEELRHLDRAHGDRRDDLPLVRVDVTADGIDIALHPRNRSRRPVSDVGLLPLEFISYAVQDTRYSRIFAFVLIRELSSRGRSTECHAFLCDTPTTARMLALSVALAFRNYEQKLAGQPFKFVVDLRWPDELEEELAEQSTAPGCSKTTSTRASFDA